jgi:hypothetical protein
VVEVREVVSVVEGRSSGRGQDERSSVRGRGEKQWERSR